MMGVDRRLSVSRLSLALVALGLTALGAADVTFGGSRAAGMGGAGLALPVDVFQNNRLNPALHGFGPKGFRLQYPRFGIRNDGISTGDVFDLLGDLTSGSVDDDLAIKLANQYGARRREFGAEAGLGFFGGGFALTGFTEAEVASIPNASLRQFIRNGGDLENAPLDAQLDAYGFGYTQIGVGYANAVQVPRATLALGLTIKTVRGYYAHKKVQGPTDPNNPSVSVGNGSGIDQNDDYVDETGVGVDLGAIYSIDRIKGLTFGAVVENAIQPNVRFGSERPNNGTFRSDYVDPFRTALNLGVGYQYRQNVLFAADLVDLGNRAGRAEGRIGVELGVSRQFAGRAGYNTRNGFTYGVALGGFNIQLGGNAPLTVGTSVRF